MAPGLRAHRPGLILALLLTATTSAQRQPRALVDAILDSYHGPLRGTFDGTVCELRSEKDGPVTTVVLALPDRMRVDRPGRRVDLLVGDVGWACAPETSARRMPAEEVAGLRTLLHCLRALYLIPLYRAEKIKRVGPGVLALILPGGETWRLEVDENELAVRELRGPTGTVQFEELLETGITRHPTRVTMKGIGRRWVRIAGSRMALDPGVFEDPFLPVPTTEKKPRRVTHQIRRGAELPRRAEVQDIPRRRYLVLGAPGTWEQRCERFLTHGQKLVDQGQAADGLPTYRIVGDTVEMLIPFRSDPAKGNQPYVRQRGQKTLYLPAHRALVVTPTPGPWDDVLKRGRGQFEKALAKDGLKAKGPLYFIPFVEPVKPPTTEQRQQLTVRLELPIE